MSTAQTAYDRVPYPSQSYRCTHPDRLATIATLQGLAPPPVERCRVLELGCASGGNLIPMAYNLPDSTFTGIDVSSRQIADGQAVVRALALPNVHLEWMDILDVTPDLGQYDYILAHGVYSWVPADVQEALIAVCRHNLAPNGVAYVSYNTYPGWHTMGVLRDMMRFYTRGLDDPRERVAKARDLLDSLEQIVPRTDDGYARCVHDCAQFLQSDLKGPRSLSDAFMLHDELYEINEPISFHQFAERAAGHGLQYLGEADFCSMMGSQLAPELLRRLNAMSSTVVELEQYMDFARNQMFRKTLLCHEGWRLSRELHPDRLKRLHVSAHAQLVGEAQEIRSPHVSRFQGADGAILRTGHPLTKAAMVYLARRWPQAVPFGELLSGAHALLNEGDPASCPETPGGAEGTREEAAADAQILATNLLEAYSHSTALIELHVHVPQMALKAGERPQASRVARLQAKHSDRVTNLRHERVQLDGAHRHLLNYLDGKHDRAAIVERLAAGPVADGTLTFQGHTRPIQDPRRVRALLAAGLETRLDNLASMALLTA